MDIEKPRVGILSFTDPRETAALAQERERYIEARHRELRDYLQKNGVNVIDPLAEMRKGWKIWFGIRKSAEVNECVQRLKAEGADALIIGCWHWTEPMLPILSSRSLNLPLCLFTEDDPNWAGATCITATGASIWETSPNPHAVTHERILGDRTRLLKWVRGVTALERLKRSSLLLWGGTYCLRMEHLQDDIPHLKSFLIGDILSEGQYILVKRAEEIARARVDTFLGWLTQNNTKIVYDGAMLTEEVLRRQIALYLAARDRLEELSEEDIAGVSVRCQPELSEEYGVTGCLLPSLLPFREDAEGLRRIVPTVCEGDIKGLITCVLLARIVPEIPPLFGDLKYAGKDYLIISNCGGSSIYYAGNTNNASEALSRVTISGQCQGASGGAVGYDGGPGELTIARLIRIKGRYLMQLGLGRSLSITPEIKKSIKWGQMWPHVALDLGVDPARWIRAAGSNHYCAIPDNFTDEVSYACREAGIPLVRIDSDQSLDGFQEQLVDLVD